MWRRKQGIGIAEHHNDVSESEREETHMLRKQRKM